MTEPLDFQKLESVCWRALCRHHVTEREMVIAATVIRLSFVIGEPNLRLDRAAELAELTNISRGNVHDVLQRLSKSRALEISEDRRIYTFLPPSKNWPWLFKERVDARLADERERGIVWAAKGPKQADFYFHAPDAGQEFAEALALERMRASLMEHHHAAIARLTGTQFFPATDRLPAAPAPSELSSGSGLSRPLETTGRGANSPVESLAARAFSRVQTAPISAEVYRSRIGNGVPESGTNSLEALKASKEAKAFNPLKSLKGEFPNREPLESLDPGASEAEIIAWLTPALGKLCGPCFDARQKCKCARPQLVPVMDKLGGWWRLRIRESRWAAINVCMELFMRLTDHTQKPLRNPGGWARDQYCRLRGEEAESKAASKS